MLPGAQFFEGDFGDREFLEEVFQANTIDAVLHCAAETSFEFSITDQGIYFHNNGIGLLDAMREFGCRRSSTCQHQGPSDLEEHPI